MSDPSGQQPQQPYQQPGYQQPQYQQPAQPSPQDYQQQAYQQPGYQQPQYQQPAPAPAAGSQLSTQMTGMFKDASTLAATGLLAAVLFATVAGVFGFLANPGVGQGFRVRLINLTDTVDVGDVALVGIAVALLLLTPDPPGGIDRPILLRVAAGLAGVISVYGVIRSLVIISDKGAFLFRFDGFIATLGVALAAATVAFYAAKESFLKEKGQI